MNVESNLLFGILALQLNFVDRSQLLVAFDRWSSQKSLPLAQHFVDLRILSNSRRELLDSLLQEHLKAHDGNIERSIAAVGASIDSSLQVALSQKLGTELAATIL